jgi:hypothetical protein
MKRLIEFPMEDGATILVEAEVPEEPGMIPAARGERGVLKAQQTFEQTLEAALDRIRPAAQVLIQKLRALHDPPDEIQVEFGLSLNAQAGAFIAAASTEAHYKITLTWRREERKPGA